MELQEIQDILYKKLDKKRFQHTLGVMYTSAALCMQYGIDINHGMLAGLLHDCGKEFKANRQYELCSEYKIKLNPSEKLNPSLIHAKLGAYLAEKKYKIHDKEILSAILCHTTGKPNMTTLDKIIYIADYIEPHRKLPRVEELRQLAFKNLDLTMYCMLDMSLEYLKNNNKIIDESTYDTHEYFKNIVNLE